MHLPPFKSEQKPVTPGASTDYFDFVPLMVDGKRVVVDKYYVVITGTITVATANWDGRDVWRIMQLVTNEQRDGKQRWNLSGYKSRMASIKYNGIEEHQEHAAVAVGAAQAVDLRALIPMAKRKIRRGKDFAQPADLFKKFTITWAALANAQTGTTVLSAASLNAYILADYHLEDSVEFKAEDVVKSTDFNSNTQAKLALQGVVHDLDIVLENTTLGGAVVTAITDARIEDLGVPLLTRQDFVHWYRVKRQITASGPTTPGTERFLEPAIEGKMLPVIAADLETSLWSGRVVESCKIDVGTGVAGLSAITREVTPKSEAAFQAQIARFNIDARSIKMKTAAKSKTGMNDGWTPREKLVGVWKAPLPQVA